MEGLRQESCVLGEAWAEGQEKAGTRVSYKRKARSTKVGRQGPQPSNIKTKMMMGALAFLGFNPAQVLRCHTSLVDYTTTPRLM